MLVPERVQNDTDCALETRKKGPLPVIGKRAFLNRNAIYSPSSSSLVGAALRLKSLAGRTFFSPGKGRV